MTSTSAQALWATVTKETPLLHVSLTVYDPHVGLHITRRTCLLRKIAFGPSQLLPLFDSRTNAYSSAKCVLARGQPGANHRYRVYLKANKAPNVFVECFQQRRVCHALESHRCTPATNVGVCERTSSSEPTFETDPCSTGSRDIGTLSL